MIPIEKGPAPEQLIDELSQIEKSDNAGAVSWSGISCKQKVLTSLIRDQRGLCAYCMRRIGEKNSHVEHIEPQSVTSEGEDVSYENMLAVCQGQYGHGRAGATCDHARGNRPLTVNPLDASTLRGIRYLSDGTITSDDESVRTDLQETLNLNSEQALLPQNRKAVIDTLNRELYAVGRRKGAGGVRAYCRTRLRSLAEENPYPEYIGVLRYFLEKRLRH